MKTRQQYDELLQVLTKSQYTKDDACAAICIITSFIFDGGAGAWQAWVGVLCDYVHSVLRRDPDPRHTFEHCAETTRFIIKVAIWFDVLAAVTTQKAPRLLEYIRKLFSPLESPAVARGGGSLPPLELSMMSVMGCENLVLWVLAEASALSVWKCKQEARGCLSVQDLIKRAVNLEAHLDTTRASPLTYNPTLTLTDARALSADIFRRATRVYLRSIMLGSFPNVREIVESVDEAIALLRRPQMPSSVVRSTMFAFLVCGALTHDERHRQELSRKLDLEEEEPAESVVGNSLSIKKLLETIWNERSKSSPRQPVQ
ncbi:fungal-specific transcription factor domain-containing protein [Mycena albidolilacea]|uniref:Fungal-specific transcription factor domain-containing protein n=1 Tax=Mycena albidolilacea TaxID=1033008 RepID=A0AAD7EB40_9AGAR|nr:fungal-specific transcription factor domain-containing protein [Mycena albidolilacea]